MSCALKQLKQRHYALLNFYGAVLPDADPAWERDRSQASAGGDIGDDQWEVTPFGNWFLRSALFRCMLGLAEGQNLLDDIKVCKTE